MMTHFENAIQRTLENEGGLVDDPHDPGGLTKFGISQRAYPKRDIANLTLAEARDIYLRDYWQRAGCDRIEHEGLACKLFDIAVNAGPLRAVKMLQRSINHFGAALKVDGKLGPKTAAAINGHRHTQAVLMAFRVEVGRYYIKLARPRFLAGWLNRLAK